MGPDALKCFGEAFHTRTGLGCSHATSLTEWLPGDYGQTPIRGVKGFISLQPRLPSSCFRTDGLDWGRRPMTALLLGVGALVLAVIAGALLDPRPRNAERADDQVPSMDEIVLAT